MSVSGCGMIKGFPRRSAWLVGYVKRGFTVTEGQTMQVDSPNVRRLRWGWRPALTRGTQAALGPVLGRRMSFEGVPYRVLVWSSGGFTHKRPVSPEFRQNDARALVDRYEQRHARLAELLDSRGGAVQLLSKYTGLVEPFIADAAAGVLCVEGGFAEVVEEVLELPKGWFDSATAQSDAFDVEWPGWSEPAVVKLRESGKAALIDDWVTGKPCMEPGWRCLVARNASMGLPFPAVPAEGRASTPGSGAAVPRVIHTSVRYRRLLVGKTRRTWLRRVTAYRQVLAVRPGLSGHHVASPPAESVELSRRRQAMATQSVVEQVAKLTGAQARAQTFLANEQHRLDKLREKKLVLRRKNVEQFRSALQRDDLVSSVTGIELAVLDALDWTREPSLMRLLTQACEVPADWFDWKREELETKMIGRRFASHVADLLAEREGAVDEAPMSAKAVLALWSGPKTPTVPRDVQPDDLPVADAPVPDASAAGAVTASRLVRPLTLLEPRTEVPVEAEQERALEYAAMPAANELVPVDATSAGPVQGELSLAPTQASALQHTEGDFETSVASRPQFVSDQSVERLMLSVTPQERPILDALIAMIVRTARDGRLTTDHALSMLTRVAAL